MADEATTTTTPVAEAPVAETPKLRIFKIGNDTIVEDASMIGLSIDEVRSRLAYTYPEAANATHRTTKNAAGQDIIEFLPVAGRKG